MVCGCQDRGGKMLGYEFSLGRMDQLVWSRLISSGGGRCSRGSCVRGYDSRRDGMGSDDD